MFCNNCGNQIKEGERFCVKCGAEVECAEQVKCEKCGAEIRPGAKFCNECGAPVSGHKEMFCSFCGQKFEEDETFCKKCGNRVGKSGRPFANIVGLNNKNKSVSASKPLADVANNNFFTSAMILRISKLFLAILLLVLTIVPGFKIVMEKFSLFSSKSKSYKFSFINPFYDLDKIDSSFEDIAALGGILVAIQCLAFLVTFVMIIAPIFKKAFDTGIGYIAPIILSACGFVYSIILVIAFSAVLEEELGDIVSVRLPRAVGFIL